MTGRTRLDPHRARRNLATPRLATALSAALLLLALLGLPVRAASSRPAPRIPGRILAVRPHDSTAFTEGLFFQGRNLIESTGLSGRSELRREDLDSGRVLARVRLPDTLFGEGAAPLPDGRIAQLTWQAHRALVHDPASLAVASEFVYRGEGWGLTSDGRRLIMSDGSARLTFRDPATFAVLGDVLVTDDGVPVENLNELEYVRGLILANVWQSADVVAIDPATGRVRWRLDLSEAWRRSGRAPGNGLSEERYVPNGLAYDPATGELWATGKCWARIFSIALPWDFPVP